MRDLGSRNEREVRLDPYSQIRLCKKLFPVLIFLLVIVGWRSPLEGSSDQLGQVGGPQVVGKDSSQTFSATPVGQTSSFCWDVCYCNGACPNGTCNGTGSGTVTLNHNLSAPFSARNYLVQPYGQSNCSSGTPVQLPVFLNVGQQLAFTVGFSPATSGIFSDYLNLSGYNLLVTGQGTGSSITILIPAGGQQFVLSESDDTATMPISFQAGGTTGTVNWKADLEYQTSGARPSPPFRLTRTFQTSGNGQHQETYASQGGKVTVTATLANGPQASPVSFLVTGMRIPPSDITTRLVNLYSNGATPRLMTGIAQMESSFLQFKRRTLYGTNAFWPLEAYDGGSHIGLMMLPTADKIDYAWNWQVNASAGVTLFSQKLASAQRITDGIIRNHNGLRKLSSVELEHMALVLYGPAASADRSKQYYFPVQSGNGWKWIVNTGGNRDGVSYADTVFSLIHNQ